MEKEYREFLQSHDWHYTRADDPRAFRQGSWEREEIRRLRKELVESGYTQQRVDEIWNEECPYEMYHFKINTK